MRNKLLLLLFFNPIAVMAASSAYPLPHVDIDLSDKLSLQRGAKYFVNYCQGCHSAEYLRYNRMAKDLGIPEDVVINEMMFAADKIGQPMGSTMSADDAKEWFGVAPPDLSLIGRLHDADWLKGYLTTFYQDPNSITGWNNAVFPNVAMPHVMSSLQGVQVAELDDKGHVSGLQLVSAGSMDSEEFDGAMTDLTAFLVYMGEPAKLVRYQYGIYVLLFLLIFAFVAYMLKKEYWRDVH